MFYSVAQTVTKSPHGKEIWPWLALKIWIHNCCYSDSPLRAHFQIKKKSCLSWYKTSAWICGGQWKPALIQRHPVSPIIHGEEVLISRGTRLITVTSKRLRGVLLAQGTTQRAGLPPIKPSLLKVQRSVTSARQHFGSWQSTSWRQWVSVTAPVY